MKAVLFATGPLDVAAAEAAALHARLGSDAVRVVAGRGEAAELRRQCGQTVVEEAGLSLIPQLWLSLGSSPAEVLCLSYGRSHRFLKLLAYLVRGRVVFLRPEGRAPLGLLAFLWVTLSRLWLRDRGALLVGSASPATLQRLEEDLQMRRPGTVVQVLRNPSPFAYLRVVYHWRDYCYLSVPWTDEGHNLLKVFGLLLPCGRREIYNEAGDSFSVRLVGTLFAHIQRRTREKLVNTWNGVRYVSRWIHDQVLTAWYKMLALPPGVTVIGSASGYYLKDIVAALRRKLPGEPVYGVLPAHLVAPAGHLFDGVIPWSPLAIVRHALGPNRTGWSAIPCTNEGYNRYKIAGFLLPLGRREIYNENGDGYPVRVWRTLVTHGFWRLRHRLFYQGLTQRRGRSLPVLAMHLLLYPFRLTAGAFVLASVRLRAKLRPVDVAPKETKTVAPAAVTTVEQVLDPAER